MPGSIVNLKWCLINQVPIKTNEIIFFGRIALPGKKVSWTILVHMLLLPIQNVTAGQPLCLWLSQQANLRTQFIGDKYQLIKQTLMNCYWKKTITWLTVVWMSIARWSRICLTMSTMHMGWLASIRHMAVSIAINTPVRPIPALQYTTTK